MSQAKAGRSRGLAERRFYTFMSLAIFAAAAVVTFVPPVEADRVILPLASAYGVAMGVSGMLIAALQGAEDFRAPILASVLQRTGALAFLLLGAFATGGLTAYVASVVTYLLYGP